MDYTLYNKVEDLTGDIDNLLMFLHLPNALRHSHLGLPTFQLHLETVTCRISRSRSQFPIDLDSDHDSSLNSVLIILWPPTDMNLNDERLLRYS